MSVYPSIVFPADPEFPIGHDDVPLGPDLYTAVASYITALVTDTNLFIDHIGNVEIAADKGIEFDATERIGLTGGEIKFTAVSVNTELVVDTPTIATLNITDDLIIDNDLIMENPADITVSGTITQDYVDRDTHTLTQAAEPGDPADNNAVLWVSNGTGYGDIGDLVCKITEGGGTTSFTLADYSAL